MDKTEVATVLANLPDDCEITVTVKLKDWLAAKEATGGGPEYATTADVARIVGFSSKYWVTRARTEKIPGAVQDGSRGRWRLPLDACRAHVRGLKGARGAPVRPTFGEYKPRGPRKRDVPPDQRRR